MSGPTKYGKKRWGEVRGRLRSGVQQAQGVFKVQLLGAHGIRQGQKQGKRLERLTVLKGAQGRRRRGCFGESEAGKRGEWVRSGGI